MRRAANARTGHGDIFGLGAGGFNQIGQAAIGRIGGDENRIGLIRQKPDIGEAFHAVARRIVIKRGHQGGQ